MKKLWKRIRVLMPVLVMCVACMAGCGKTEEDANNESPMNEETGNSEESPEGQAESDVGEPVEETAAEAIVGYYTYYYTFGDTGTEIMPNFFHFYEPDPVMGNIFVAEFAYNQINMAGRYEVKEEEIECTFCDGREAQIAEEYITKTVPYTVTLYDMDGNEQDICGFDGRLFYATTQVYTFQGAGEVPYTKETPDESEIGQYLTGEVGISYETWIYDEDDTCFVTLYVNRSYDDLMEMMENGSFTLESDDTGITYTLDTGAVLVNHLDGTGLYTSAGGSEYSVHLDGYGAGEPVAFTGTFPFSGTDAEVALILVSDSDCEVYLRAFGQEMLVDGGSYTVDEEGVYSFSLQGAGEITSEEDADSGKATTHYVYNLEDLGADMDLMLIIQTAEKAEFEVMSGTFTYMETDAEVRLNIVSDTECEIYLCAYGQEMQIDGGTYEINENGSYTFMLQTAGEAVSETDEETGMPALHYINNLKELQADMDLMLIAQ